MINALEYEEIDMDRLDIEGEAYAIVMELEIGPDVFCGIATSETYAKLFSEAPEMLDLLYDLWSESEGETARRCEEVIENLKGIQGKEAELSEDVFKQTP